MGDAFGLGGDPEGEVDWGALTEALGELAALHATASDCVHLPTRRSQGDRHAVLAEGGGGRHVRLTDEHFTALNAARTQQRRRSLVAFTR